MSEIRPYTIIVADEEIEKLKSRLEISRFPEKETTGDWSQGVPLAYIKNMTDYWLKKYDFKRFGDSSKWLDSKWHCRKLVAKM